MGSQPCGSRGASPATETKPQSAATSKRQLMRDSMWTSRLRVQASPTAAAPLPTTPSALQAAQETARRPGAEEASSGSSTSGGSDENVAARARTLQAQRSKRRLTAHLEEAMETELSTGKTFLERNAVSKAARKNYERMMQRLEMYCRAHRLPLGSDEECDAALVHWFNHLYFHGEQPAVGEKALAGLMDRHPRFGRLGSSRLPRSWRALRGWRRLTPSRSRKPLPWAVWTAIAWRMVEHERLDMAVYTLLGVTGYFRPGELLAVRRCDLIAPSDRALRSWSALLFPEMGRPSKTGVFNDSVALDCPLTACLAPALEALSDPHVTASAWNFSYPAYTRMFARVTKELSLHNVVPYQMRHSGPSIDMAAGRRGLQDVQKRGRWQSSKSVLRYERHARLGAEWSKLSPAQRDLFGRCADHLEDVIHGRPHPLTMAALDRT